VPGTSARWARGGFPGPWPPCRCSASARCWSLHGAPLEVFEERFLIMMANMLKTVQARFEVVLIESGHQLGAARRCPENDLPAGAGLSQNTKADWDVRPVDDSGRRSRAQAESSSDNAAVWRQISELPGFSVRRDRNARPKRDLALEMKRTSVPDILEMLRDGYDEVDALTHKERDALPDAFRLATVACSAWSYNNGFQDYALDAMQHAESL
jgi:hypothetical protein